MEIRFWGYKSNYFEFTNFYRAPIIIEDIKYPTSEHYYQSMKFKDYPELQKKIVNTEKARDVYLFVKKKECQEKINKDWNKMKLDVMRKAVLEKFRQHPKLKKLLLDTDNKIIVENSPNDNFWGVGGFGKPFIKGENNWLGVILMEVREKLKVVDENENTKTY